MSRDPQCIFCLIASGDAPAHFVHEGDTVMAFLDINPFVAGHTLVVPRDHGQNLSDVDPGVGGEMFAVAQRLATALRQSLACDGVNLVLSDGRAAGQEVMHAHLHVVPRTEGDGMRILRGHGEASEATPGLEETAAGIREALENGAG